MSGVSIVNVIPNSTIYGLTATTNDPSIPSTVSNLSLNEINNSLILNPAENVESFRYDRLASNQRISTYLNTYNSLGLNPTLIYLWINNNPNNSANIPSNVATKFSPNGQMYTPSSTSNNPSSLKCPIIQWTGSQDTNNRQQYLVYNKEPLTVINNTNENIKLQTSSTPFTNVNNNYMFPSTMTYTSGSSSVITITPNNRSNISSAFPYYFYTDVYVWSGSTSVGQIADYGVNFRGYDFHYNDEFFGSTFVRGTWDQNNRTLIITSNDAPVPGPTEKNMVGSACSANNDCSSNNCVQNICTAVYTGSSCTYVSDCFSNSCDTMTSVCGKSSIGRKCISNEDCTSGNCSSGICIAVNVGQPCNSNNDCTSKACSLNNVCIAVGNDFECTTSNDCVSGNCSGGICRAKGESIGDGDDGFRMPWWFWVLLIGIFAILIITMMVIAHRKSRRPPNLELYE